MLSILIPVYNYNVDQVVRDLSSQSDELGIIYEIICLNDASDSESPPNPPKNLKWEINTENLGRARSRNKLIQLAKFDTLIFLDADMKINPEFISKYVDGINDECVVCGGIEYDSQAPAKDQILRWNYGKKREQKHYKKRQKTKYTSFMTGNFMMPKDVFQKVSFDNSLSSYGHEDTLFGKELLENGIDIHHIENPAIHEGLKSNEDFIKKSKIAIESLHQLYKHDKLNRNYSSLIKLYERLNSFKLFPPVLWLIRLLEKQFGNNLKEKGKSIWLLQLLKLKWFSEQANS